MEHTISETREEICLAKIGRTGSKTHRALVKYRIKDEGKPWTKRIIDSVDLLCSIGGGCGRIYSHGVTPFLGHDASKATCEMCNPK